MRIPHTMHRDLSTFCPDIDLNKDYPPQAIPAFCQRLQNVKRNRLLKKRRAIIDKLGLKPGVLIAHCKYPEKYFGTISSIRQDDLRIFVSGKRSAGIYPENIILITPPPSK